MPRPPRERYRRRRRLPIAVPYVLAQHDKKEDERTAQIQKADNDAHMDARQKALEELLQRQITEQNANGERQAADAAALLAALRSSRPGSVARSMRPANPS